MRKSIFLKVRDTELYVVKVGKGFPIFILHGGPGLDHIDLGYKFDPLMDDFCLLYVDQRGHGLSKQVEESTLTVKNMAEDINELAKQLGYTKYAVLGHSFGAFVALQHAVDFGNDSVITILLNGAKSTNGLQQYQEECMGYFGPDVRNEMLNNMNQAQQKFGAVEQNIENLNIFIKELTDAKLPQYFPVSNDSLIEFKKYHDQVKINGYILHIMSSNNYGDYELSERMHEVENQVLIITSDKDYICDPKMSEIMSKEIHNSELYVVKNAGHYPFYDQQEETISAIREFLKRKI
ncbi:MAG: alpha/beta hydrolase [Bacilli bacterium]|nr:alpha/beta hydrolase [Bacilli bacterium]MBN2876310.1 alpha/beta hydrolase [Bacilli bacterium]